MKTSPVHKAAATDTSLLTRRFAGMGIDLVVLLLPFLAVRALVPGRAMALVILTVLAIALFGIVQGETGTTPGKSVMGLRLVNEHGRPPGTAMALLRLAAWAIDALPCLGLIGALLVWFSPTHQRVGDTITRTFVLGPDPDGDRENDPEGNPDGDTRAGAQRGPAPAPYQSVQERQDFKPLWDRKVDAYIQWDPAMKRWMKYDEQTQNWTPVRGE